MLDGTSTNINNWHVCPSYGTPGLKAARKSHPQTSCLLEWCSIQTKPRASMLQTCLSLTYGTLPQPLDFSNHQLLPYHIVPMLGGTQVHLWSFLPPTECCGIPELTHPASEPQFPPSFQVFLPKDIQRTSQPVIQSLPGWGDGASVKPLLSLLHMEAGSLKMQSIL